MGKLGVRVTVTLAMTLTATLLIASPASAQIVMGGRYGGTTGGGPGGTSSPSNSTGGDALAEEALFHHVLDRITYGATAFDATALRHFGIDDYIRWQLNPSVIPENDVLTAKLAELPPKETAVGDPMWDWVSLYRDYFLRAIYSRRQLNEVLTEHWQNHFDTGLDEGDGGFIGFHSSMRLDAGRNRFIAYYSRTERQPYVVSFSDQLRLLRSDVVGIRGAGEYTSLALTSSGRPRVSMYDRDNQDLHLSRFDGTVWRVELVDAVGDVGQWTSLQLDPADNPVIAYYGASSGDLKLASHDGTSWRLQVVDAADDVGQHASLALDSTGRPRVAYYDATNGDLKYAWFDGTVWTREVVDAPGDVGRWCSLGLDATQAPAIAYYDASNGDLKLARKLGPTWSITTIDVAADVGQHASLAFDPTGQPAVAYHDATNYDQKLARYDGVSWRIEVIESGATADYIQGEWSSLAFDPLTQTPILSAYNGSLFALTYSLQLAPPNWVLALVDSLGTERFLYTRWEDEETQGFRDNALGSFRDLLQLSATSPAMMLFLDNHQNVAGNGNENYARELLELHTVGVDGGYDQTDVEETARLLTGWGLVETSVRCDFIQGSFCYNHAAHDPLPVTILGVTYPAVSTAPANWRDGMARGEALLDRLAIHPSTARFNCKKLVQRFVDDAPPTRVWNDCIDTWLRSKGDIKRVVATILDSEDFRSPAHMRTKVRTPMEFVVAPVRQLEGDSLGLYPWYFASYMGMPVFRNSVPTGYSELGVDWINSNSLLQRWKVADLMPHLTEYTIVYPAELVEQAGITTAEGVVEYFVDKLLRGHATALERSLLIDCVSGGSPSTFDIRDPLTAGRIRDTVGIMLGFDEYQKH